MKKLCIIYNFAQRYREGIFKLIDKEYDCHWYFGINNTDIEGLDTTVLRNVSSLKNKTVIKEPIYYQKNAVKLIFNKTYSDYLILGDTFCLSTWLLALIAKLFFHNKHVYFWSHGWYGKESSLIAKLKRIYFNLPDGVFLYGNYAKKLMTEAGFNPNKLYVIHNSLNYSEQIKLRNQLSPTNCFSEHFCNNNLNIIFIGRLTKVKKINLLIEAIKTLKERNKNINLTLIGDGEMRRELENLTEKYQLNSNIWFYGKCYDDAINSALIYNADLCVSPGNVGLTSIHSMMFGTPVISHNCFKYQMPEFEAIKPGITGDYFEYEDSLSLADTIERWFKMHSDDRDTVRENCYREIDSSWTPEFQISIFKNVIE